VSRGWRLARHTAAMLTANRSRTFLMMLGLAAGVAVLSTVTMIASGTRRRVNDLVNKHGLDMLMVRAGGDVQVFAPTADRGIEALFESDARAIAEEIPDVRMISPVQNKRGITVVFEDRSHITRPFGVAPPWIDIRRWGVAEGEFLSDADMAGTTRVALLGAGVARRLFPEGGAVGRTIRVNGDPYTVKGVFIEMGVDAGGDDWDDRVVVPFTTSSRRLFGRPHLEQIVMLVSDPRRVAETAGKIRELLRVRHQIGAGEPDDFFVREPADVEGAALETSSTLTWLLFGVAAVALAAGGLVIMNLMLLAVTQRAPEIALRRAIGARVSDIRRQFLLEALMVALAGAVTGAVVGLGAALLLDALGLAAASPTWAAFALAILSCGIIGLLAGIYPARRAAAVEPAAGLGERKLA